MTWRREDLIRFTNRAVNAYCLVHEGHRPTLKRKTTLSTKQRLTLNLTLDLIEWPILKSRLMRVLPLVETPASYYYYIMYCCNDVSRSFHNCHLLSNLSHLCIGIGSSKWIVYSSRKIHKRCQAFWTCSITNSTCVLCMRDTSSPISPNSMFYGNLHRERNFLSRSTCSIWRILWISPKTVTPTARSLGAHIIKTDQFRSLTLQSTVGCVYPIDRMDNVRASVAAAWKPEVS